MKNKDNTFLLPTIFAFALALRLIGINHGFPFILHPDEPTVIRTAQSLQFFPNPGHFDWPHLFIYVNYFCYIIFGQFLKMLQILDLKDYIFQYLPILWDSTLIYYLISRIIAAVMGAMTVIPIYLAGRDNYGKSVGILAAITMAVVPFHVWHSHYALIDVPMLFFASWGIYFSLNIIKRKNVYDYTGSGFYIGLASSTKYNAGLISVMVPFAHILRVIKNKKKILEKNSIIALLLSILTFSIGFLIGTPYALLDYQTFLRTDGPKGALWQFTNVGSLDISQRIPAFFERMIYKVSDDVGYTVLVGFFLLLAILVYRKIKSTVREEDLSLWFLFSMGMFLLIYVSGVKNSRSHYFFIAYPFIILCFAYLLDNLMKRASVKSSLLGFILFTITLGLPTFLAVRNAYTFSRSDTRVVLYKWLKSNLSPNATLIYNKNNLSQITSMFPNKSAKLVPNMQLNSPYYIIVSYDTSDEIQEIDIEKYMRGAKKFATVTNELRLGPKIEIYSTVK